jgi:peroxiredoxin
MRAAVLLVLLPALALAGGCGHGRLPWTEVEPSTADDPAPPGPKGTPPRDLDTFDPAAYRGSVLIVELGCVGCGPTHEAYLRLREYSRRKPANCRIVRIDHGQSVEANSAYYREHPPPFEVYGDPTGEVGRSFPSQAMPTIFVYGRWGQLRYRGRWDDFVTGTVIPALALERTPDPKNVYLRRGLERGDELPALRLGDLWSGKAVDVREAALAASSLVLAFVDLSCPVCREALGVLGTLHAEHGESGLSIAAVFSGEIDDTVRSRFREMNLGFPVLADAGGKAFASLGLEGVPATFVVDPDGRIAFRGLWNEVAVRESVLVALGLLDETERTEGALDNEGSG